MSSKNITPDTCGTILFEKKSVRRCNQVKIRSYWNRVGPESNDWCPYKRKEKKTEIEGEKEAHFSPLQVNMTPFQKYLLVSGGEASSSSQKKIHVKRRRDSGHVSPALSEGLIQARTTTKAKSPGSWDWDIHEAGSSPCRPIHWAESITFRITCQL